MPEISAALVKQLREQTQLPMMDCKKALQEARGDPAKAEEILRKSGALAAAKKAGRETAEGRIAAYVNPDYSAAALVEVRCETAPVAGTAAFVALCGKVARHLAEAETVPSNPDALMAQSPASEGKTIQEMFNEVINKIRENMKPVRCARLAGGVVAAYEHHNGQVAALVQLESDGPLAPDESIVKFARDLCMHITAASPVALDRDRMPPDLVAKEKEIIQAQVAEQAKGKPPQIAEKIAQGKLNKWYNEMVLLEQPYVKDDKKSVRQTIDEFSKAIGKKITVARYLRYEVGGTD